MLNKTLKGLVIELPEQKGFGVIIDATKQGKELYKATVVCESREICILQFKTASEKIGEIIKPIDYAFYDSNEIASIL